MNGSLEIRNTTGSATGTGAVTVFNGGGLSGMGRISGPVTINQGGTVAPGEGTVGVLSVATNMTLQPGATFRLDLGTTATVSSHALLQVDGVLSLKGANLVINSFGNTLRVGDTVTIINDAATVGRFSSGTGVQSTTGVAYQINYNLNSVSLTVTSLVPEPATWEILGTGALVLATARFRRGRAGAAR